MEVLGGFPRHGMRELRLAVAENRRTGLFPCTAISVTRPVKRDLRHT
jgi:hypothetical protein